MRFVFSDTILSFLFNTQLNQFAASLRNKVGDKWIGEHIYEMLEFVRKKLREF
jgi:hypothetical protein